jgi:bacterioferritin (cytochrome b1)
MATSEETLDRDEAVERLNVALRQQYRSALGYSAVAASIGGIDAIGLGPQLSRFSDEELNGVRVLIAKIVSFGGQPTSEIAELRYESEAEAALEWLAGCEEELVDKLQEAIEPTGREGRSEALEHMLEHLIMRKQEQVDFLRRAIGS